MIRIKELTLCLAVAAGLAFPGRGVVAQSAAVPPDRIVTPVALPDGSVALLVSTVDAAARCVTSTLVAAETDPARAAANAPGASPPGAGSAGAAADAAGALAEVAVPQVFQSAYTDVQGTAHTLRTEELPHETAAMHAARHAAAFLVLANLFPVATPSTLWSGSLPMQGIEAGMQLYDTSWTDVNGITQHVITVRKTGETEQKWAERHAEGVKEMLKAFPPKPQTACLQAESPLRLAA